TDRWAVVLQAVVPHRQDDGSWWALDPQGHALPLQGKNHWQWLALSGGWPLDVAGEWDGAMFTPLAAYVADRYTLLSEAR
ncbi:MAG: SWIM zinc finger family protein, partial [Burkholderiales bacterium]|nr:SWIM zinc finger family protein [Burkholderiales bacterium]